MKKNNSTNRHLFSVKLDTTPMDAINEEASGHIDVVDRHTAQMKELNDLRDKYSQGIPRHKIAEWLVKYTIEK